MERNVLAVPIAIGTGSADSIPTNVFIMSRLSRDIHTIIGRKLELPSRDIHIIIDNKLGLSIRDILAIIAFQ